MTDTPMKFPGVDIIEALLPPEMALACEAAGVAKAGRDVLALIVLGLLAGAFIALGAIFMTVVRPVPASSPGALHASWPALSSRSDLSW